MTLRNILRVIAGGAWLLPLFASGHGNEFLLAKITLPDDGSVTVEITADYSANPMLANEAEARAALQKALSVVVGDRVARMDELAPLRYEDRTRFDPTCPLPSDPLSENQEHELITAVWNWKPNVASFSFESPKENPLSLLLWRVDLHKPDEKPGWVIMIAGDRSPLITLVQPQGGSGSSRKLMFAGSAAGLIMLALLWMATHRSKASI